MLSIKCKACGTETKFDQPYAYHAGFSNQGFLYNDAGDLTLVWSSFDPGYQEIVGKVHPWALNAEYRARLERALRPAPSGGTWRFSNPARCPNCARPIGEPMTETISYLFWAGSIDADRGLSGGTGGLGEFLQNRGPGP